MNREKCRLGKNSVDFLGYEFSQNGMMPLAKKVEFISLLKPPKTVRDVRSFIGLVNYYKSFCENFSALTAPFNNLLRGSNKKPKRSPILWNDTLQVAFDKVLEALKKSETLAYDDISRPLVLTTDASKNFCGAVLEQFSDPNDDNNNEYE